jgi:IS5 family transposase
VLATSFALWENLTNVVHFPGGRMLGTLDPQMDLLDTDTVCGHLVREGSLYRHLATLGDALFTDADFADLFHPGRGRHSVPPSLLAKVSLLQRLEDVSDPEAVERVRCDMRWKVALGLPLGYEGFHSTVLVYFRQRLRASASPRRVFDRFKQVAEEAGLIGKRGMRVLDSTPILSAVATKDTVSMIRGGVRRLLKLVAESDPDQARALRQSLARGDYDEAGKPAIDWDDQLQREALVDELVRDALALLAGLEGRALEGEVAEAAELVATVAGQDVEQDEEGRFRIRRGVAADRVISIVDPEARHGRKSRAGGYDGYKANLAVDPDTELITEVTVTAANTADAVPTLELLPELTKRAATDQAPGGEDAAPAEAPDQPAAVEPEQATAPGDGEGALVVVADTAYGSGANRKALLDTGASLVIKAPPEANATGGFAKSEFTIDLEANTATCPAGNTTTEFHPAVDGGGRFQFPASVCNRCPLRWECTASLKGRSVAVGPHEELLAAARAEQRTEAFQRVYKGKRPTVERVISRVVRNGRKARYRGKARVEEQVVLKAAAENLVRMLRLGLVWEAQAGWALA